jgi:phage shock protein B
MEDFMGYMVGIIAIVSILIILPWVILHHISKWKTAASLTTEDENLLDELHELARRLDERMCTIERIIQAENPNWRSVACDPVETALEDRSNRLLETSGLDPDRIPARRSNRSLGRDA